MRPTIFHLRVFVAAVICLLSRYLATIGGIHIQTHRLVGGIYDVCRWDGLRCHDIHTKFHKYCFSYSKVDGGGDSQTQPSFIYFFYKEIRLKSNFSAVLGVFY
jgi:hypothetical protein